jgi:hypothetical protein
MFIFWTIHRVGVVKITTFRKLHSRSDLSLAPSGCQQTKLVSSFHQKTEANQLPTTSNNAYTRVSQTVVLVPSVQVGSLFNDAFSVTRLYSVMISEWWGTGKDLVGSGRGLISRYYANINLTTSQTTPNFAAVRTWSLTQPSYYTRNIT